MFGSRLAVEVQLHHAGGSEAALAAALIELAERSRITWVATNDPRYLDSAGRLVHDLLTANRADLCVNTAASWGLLLPERRVAAQVAARDGDAVEGQRSRARDCARDRG